MCETKQINRTLRILGGHGTMALKIGVNSGAQKKHGFLLGWFMAMVAGGFHMISHGSTVDLNIYPNCDALLDDQS